MSNIKTTQKVPTISCKPSISDITHTTAKVSIGNTTISVPLIKPVSATKFMPESADIYKTTSSSTKHAGALNIKGQKLNSPTIVSLSQLQIKPSNNTKIVQATVVSGKHLQNSAEVKLTGNTLPIMGNKSYKQKCCQNRDVNTINQNNTNEYVSPNYTTPTCLEEMSKDTQVTSCDSISYGHKPLDSKMQKFFILDSRNNSMSDKKVKSPSSNIVVPFKSDVNVTTFQRNKYPEALNSGLNKSSPASITTMVNVNPMCATSISVDQRTSTPILSGISTLPLSSELSNQSSIDQVCRMTPNKTNANSQREITTYANVPPINVHQSPSHILKESRIRSDQCNENTQDIVLKTERVSDIKIEHELDYTTLKSSAFSKLKKTPTHSKESNKDLLAPQTSICESLDDISIWDPKHAYEEEVVEYSPPKIEETQNLLLKQLLKNTSSNNFQVVSTISPSPLNNHSLLNRKVINVRAPSLGLVSSLEAQLARPVIPPVPAVADLTITTSIEKNSEITAKRTDTKLKQHNQIISKETSFLSTPKCSLTNLKQGASYGQLSVVHENSASSRNMNAGYSVSDDSPNSTGNSQNASVISETNKVDELCGYRARNLKYDPKRHLSYTILDNDIKVDTKSQQNYFNKNHPNSVIKETNNISKSEINGRQIESIYSKNLSNFHHNALTENQLQTKSQNPKDSHYVKKPRKRRKRELNKNLLNNNCIHPKSHKKGLRKFCKIEEDYDIFMDSVVSQLRKMPALDIQEPFLCEHKGINDMKRLLRNEKHENSASSQLNQKQKQNDIFDFHEETSFNNSSDTKQNSFVMQNDFYDQEFLSYTSEKEQQKFCKLLSNANWRNMDFSENVFIRKSMDSSTELALHQCDANIQESFPGLVTNNKEHVGRQSPVIPFVEPVPIKLQSILYSPLSGQPNNITSKKIFSNYNKGENSLTVILTVSSVELVGVLRDLPHLLNMPPISSYRVIADVKAEVTNNNLKGPASECRLTGRYMNDVESILNGSKKLCRNCGYSFTKITLRLSENPSLLFCSTECCYNYKKQLNLNPSILENFMKVIYNTGLKKQNIRISERILPNMKKCRFKFFKCIKGTSQTRREIVTQKEVEDIISVLKTTRLMNCNSLYENNERVEMVADTRHCILCNGNGDGISDGPSRLLNYDVDKWVHLNCALWSDGVYETTNGGLINVETAIQTGRSQICVSCHRVGATIKCCKSRCDSTYHIICAKKDQCAFYKNKTFYCRMHYAKSLKHNELTSLKAQRRVFIKCDENDQVSTFIHHQEFGNLLRVGSLILLKIGQLLPHQFEVLHKRNCIYPVNYKIMRFYWSMEESNKRCCYECTISEEKYRPEFKVRVLNNEKNFPELKDSTPNLVWLRILNAIVTIKKKTLEIFPKYFCGDEFFGLTEGFIVRILECMPGIETIKDYRFRYEYSTSLHLPLKLHTSGAARTDPQQRQSVILKKPHTQRTVTTSQLLSSQIVIGEAACPYSKQFVHSKSSQYKKMNLEWRNNVYLARSKIQGLGLYAARGLEKHTMVIEYIGEVIRAEVSEIREKQYKAKNRGIYMFRLDEEHVVDATLSGGLARYVNHSCDPNCVTEIVDVEREHRIIIFAKRRINRGEELSYDYKFDIEDDAHKLPCMCGASNCKKWMN